MIGGPKKDTVAAFFVSQRPLSQAALDQIRATAQVAVTLRRRSLLLRVLCVPVLALRHYRLGVPWELAVQLALLALRRR